VLLQVKRKENQKLKPTRFGAGLDFGPLPSPAPSPDPRPSPHPSPMPPDPKPCHGYCNGRTTSHDMRALSHISHNVNEDVRKAAEWYKYVMGWVEAYNIEDPGWGPGYWPKMGNAEGCLVCADICDGMGLKTCLGDFMWIWHPDFNLYFELIQFFVPEPKNLTTGKTWDDNGWRHIALEVSNVTEVYYRIKDLPGVDVQASGPPHETHVVIDGVESIAPFTYFYWKDKYGVFWEMEQGRAIASPLPLSAIGGGNSAVTA